MKKHFLKSFALIAMLFSALTMNAKQYCHEPLTLNGGATIYLSCELISDGQYRITIEGENLQGLGGSFYNPGAVDLRNAIATKTETKIVCDIAATSAPTLYTPLYVLCPGEQNIGWPNDIEWTGTCGEGGEDPVEPTPDPEPEPETPSVVYCDFPTGHNGDANFGDANGRILVSVVKKSETAVRLVVKSADAATKNLDLLYVEAAGANPHATTVGGDVAESGLREMSVDITYPTAPAKYSFMIQWSHPDWAGRWQTNLNDITIEQLCTDGGSEGGETPDEGSGDGLIVTEYCDYTDANLTKNGAAIALTWETADNGDVVITMSNGAGAESCAFRNGGFEGGIEGFVVSTDDFTTTSPASDYFTFEKVYSGNEARLVKVADLQKGAKIKYDKSKAFAWTVNEKDEYNFLDFIYTYGGVCNKLDAPINVAVTEAGVITFDEVIGANAYEVRVYQGAMLKYTQEIVNGGTINFVAYVDGEYLVKVVAKGEGKGDSSESDPVSWNVKASPLPMSNYCETLADAVTANNGSCSPLFSWVTDAAGNVVITVSASEGNEGETMFRNNGMNGAFSLDGSVDNFNAYFNRGKTDDYTYTLTLKDAANKPLPGAVISFSGQIEAKSSINNNDWSNYVFNGYLYGTNCTIEDNEKPVMGTAALLSNNYDVAIIEVSATDNIEVAKYRVVDENNGYDKSFKPADGKITVTHLTPSTKYTLTITALDFADNESENSATVEVTTEAHNYKPTAAPAAPTVAEKKVISLYSDAYATTNNFTAHEGWGDATIYQELDLEGNKVRYYTNLNYLGWQHINGPINALNMEKLHLDIWAEFDGSLKVTPIYGGEGLTTDDSKGKVVELKGQQWNSIDFELTEFVGLDWSSIYQFKFDLPVGGTTFAIDNVYFYRETEIADTEAPTDVVATLKSASYTSVVITCQAADNSGTVSFDIFDGETKVATSGAESGKPVDVTVANLEAGKTFNLSVVAYDINENKAAAVSVEATTLALPVAAPAPTHAAENVYSIYSNAYTSSVYFIIGGWGQATVATEVNLAAEDKAYLLQNTNYLGWEINNNQPFDVSAYNKFHIDIYALAEGTLQITPISAGPKENLQTLTLKEGWNQIDMDCATFEGVEFDQVIQIKFAEGGNATYFIDNVYFHKVAPTDPTSVENNVLDNRSMKVIENGRLFIIRNGVTYDVTGRVVR